MSSAAVYCELFNRRMLELTYTYIYGWSGIGGTHFSIPCARFSAVHRSSPSSIPLHFTSVSDKVLPWHQSALKTRPGWIPAIQGKDGCIGANVFILEAPF
ncbi:hypothetical protein PMIN04_006143 [Paraphaeosphaeria minitans]